MRLVLPVLVLALAGPALAETTVSRMHVIFDPVTREVRRVPVSVVDPHPEMHLDFIWEPDSGNWPGVTGDGMADGPGRVIWRVPGTADYDPRAMHHRYVGTLRQGRFHGAGTLTYRDGTVFEGLWDMGKLSGPGMHLDGDGNRYEGPFVNGLAEGTGIYRARDGWIYTGTFRAGRRHGQGHMTLPGGASFDVVMDNGTEVGGDRPVLLPDRTLGGLLPAQSGGEAARTHIAVITDQRITADQSIQYTHLVTRDAVQIYPSDPEIGGVWEGTGQLKLPFTFFEMTKGDWDATRAFALVDLDTQDGSRVRLDNLSLAVEYSVPHLRPMLEVESHEGCSGFRPTFNFRNHGWGAVNNARIRVRFANPESVVWDNPDAVRPGTGWFDLPPGTVAQNFFEGADVSVRNVLIDAGVDVGTLENRRFSCFSLDLAATCRNALLPTLNMGQLTGLIAGDSKLYTDLLGELSYDWTDATGQAQQVTESFSANVSLAVFEVPGGLAECGAGGGYATDAPQFLDVELPATGENYRIEIPFRGNPNISRLTSGLKLWSQQSSFHRMRIEARFADGSIRTSPTVELFFMHPRQSEFSSAARPPACYLGQEVFSSC